MPHLNATSKTYHSVVFCVSGTTRDEDDEAEDKGWCARSKANAIEEEDKVKTSSHNGSGCKIAAASEAETISLLSTRKKKIG